MKVQIRDREAVARGIEIDIFGPMVGPRTRLTRPFGFLNDLRIFC